MKRSAIIAIIGSFSVMSVTVCHAQSDDYNSGYNAYRNGYSPPSSGTNSNAGYGAAQSEDYWRKQREQDDQNRRTNMNNELQRQREYQGRSTTMPSSAPSQSLRSLPPLPSSSNTVALHATVNSPDLNIRKCPALGCAIKARLPRQTSVAIVGERKNGWVEVMWFQAGLGVSGFVNRKYLDLEPPPPPPSPTPVGIDK